MRRASVLLVLVAVLAFGGAARAATGSPVACGPTCDPGGGYTGCKSASASHSSSVWAVYSIKHVLVVTYCKRNGVITSISIARNFAEPSARDVPSTPPP